MTGKQSGVLWLGLLLIITRLFTSDQWSDLWSTFGTASTGAGGKVSKSGQANGKPIFGPGGREPL
jgi:hypothetical protein